MLNIRPQWETAKFVENLQDAGRLADNRSNPAYQWAILDTRIQNCSVTKDREYWGIFIIKLH
jgi:predicted GNAT family acetyltransferase